MPRRVNARLAKLLDEPIAALARGMEEYAVIRLVFLEYHAEHRIVDGLCAEAAAHREDEGLTAELKLRLGEIGVDPENISPYRQTRDNAGILRLHVFLRLLCGEHHSVHSAGEGFICHAGEGVLLVYGRGHAHFGSHTEHGAADIAAETDDEVGLKILDYLLCLR